MVHSEELCASVAGFSNNCYRCCESIEEGRRALDAFLGTQVAEPSPTPTPQNAPRPAPPEHRDSPAMPIDDSWWCCFAGAEPGVYTGL